MSVMMLEKVIDSKNFTVGGGVASALSGAMAAGMVSMVSRLSLKKEYGLTADEYNKISEEADSIANILLNGSILDEKAFCMIKDAYGLPKIDEEDKKIRSKAIENAGISAATVPKDNGYYCKRVNELAKKLENNSNPNAGSDLQSAIMLSDVGIKGCVLNIEANLSLIKNEKIKSEFEEHIKILKGEII